MTNMNDMKDSKFRLILVAAKRARQVQSGAKPLVHTTARKSTRIAQEEIKAGLLPYELFEPEPEGESQEAPHKEPVHPPKAKK